MAEPSHGSGTSGSFGTQATTVTTLSSEATPFAEATSDITSTSHEVAVAVDIPTITNRSVVQVQATKVWNDGDADASRHPEITFHLMQSVDGSTPVKVEGQDRTISAGATGDALTVVWKNLPKRNDAGLEIAYSVIEEPVVGYSSDVTGSMAEGFTISNTPSYGFSLLKRGVSADGKTEEGALSGARFTVSFMDGDSPRYVAKDGSAASEVVELETDESGRILVPKKLAPNTYTIREVQAPAGYQLPKGAMTLKINGDGTAEFASLSGAKTTIGSVGGQFSITVTDVKVVDSLPQTGGMGTLPLFLAGISAIAAAVVKAGLSRLP